MLNLQRLAFSGELLRRGFWLYVWEIETAGGDMWLYVGRTGDSSSAHAQSPFNRLSQHLGSNKHANALRRQLIKASINPELCRSFEMIACGPIHPEASTIADHQPLRNRMAALECALRDALHEAGYAVLNEVHCRHGLDLAVWREVKEAFTKRFPRLATAGTEVHDELQAR